MVAVRLLLAASVNVQTSVLLAAGQETHIYNQSALNDNLKKFGLPTGTMVLVSHNSASAEPRPPTSTPAPPSAGNTATSAPAGVNIPILAGTIVGAAVGVIALLLCIRSYLLKRGAEGKGSSTKYLSQGTSSIILDAQVPLLRVAAQCDSGNRRPFTLSICVLLASSSLACLPIVDLHMVEPINLNVSQQDD